MLITVIILVVFKLPSSLPCDVNSMEIEVSHWGVGVGEDVGVGEGEDVDLEGEDKQLQIFEINLLPALKYHG
ncbi:hypothetical protein Tco_0450417 [Tanacetum coccineum]